MYFFDVFPSLPFHVFEEQAGTLIDDVLFQTWLHGSDAMFEHSNTLIIAWTYSFFAINFSSLGCRRFSWDQMGTNRRACRRLPTRWLAADQLFPPHPLWIKMAGLYRRTLNESDNDLRVSAPFFCSANFNEFRTSNLMHRNPAFGMAVASLDMDWRSLDVHWRCMSMIQKRQTSSSPKALKDAEG